MAKTPTPNDSTPTDETPDETPEPIGATPQPTEQLPMESAPVSATDAASGGATGLGNTGGIGGMGGENPKQPSVFRRHPLATGIAAGAIAVVLVSGLTAWGVGAAVTASLTSSTAAEAPMVMPTPAPTAGSGTTTTGRLAFRATIQAIDGDSWSILTKKGKTVTVMVDGSTQFGTKKATATAGSFAVGDSVIIVATRGTSDMPTATRIVKSPTGS